MIKACTYEDVAKDEQWILVNPPPLYQYNVQVPINIQLICQTR